MLAAFTPGLSRDGDTAYGLPMGIGAWLGTLLLINVWLGLGPNQKKVMGITASQGETDIARARKTIATVARINAVRSIPMLMFMVAASHGVAL